MKSYNYKIQRITGSIKELETMILLRGVRGLDKICVRSLPDYKVIDTYTGYFQYHPGKAEEKTIEYFHSQELEYEKYGQVVYEVVRK